MADEPQTVRTARVATAPRMRSISAQMTLDEAVALTVRYLSSSILPVDHRVKRANQLWADRLSQPILARGIVRAALTKRAEAQLRSST